jgi:CheY-like chemotaxis protein
MSNVFKCFLKPYSIAFIDDDRDFLELLAMAVPASWNGHFFSKTHTFIDYLQHNTLLAQRDLALFSKVFSWENGKDNAITHVIHYWRQNPQRWSVCDLALLDFSMPKMTGLDVLNELPNWQGLRVLLTGVADEKVAVQAFNQSLIQHYLPKQSDDLIGKLNAAVSRLNLQLHSQQQMLVKSHLSDTQLGLLRHESSAFELQMFAKTHWVEYLVLGNPFGILGLSATGQLSWLQLERSGDIDDLKSIAHTEHWDAQTLQAIARGNVLSNSLLRQALDDAINPAVAPITPFGDNDLIGAFFEFDAPLALRASSSYADWFAANRSRLIKD